MRDDCVRCDTEEHSRAFIKTVWSSGLQRSTQNLGEKKKHLFLELQLGAVAPRGVNIWG